MKSLVTTGDTFWALDFITKLKLLDAELFKKLNLTCSNTQYPQLSPLLWGAEDGLGTKITQRKFSGKYGEEVPLQIH